MNKVLSWFISYMLTFLKLMVFAIIVVIIVAIALFVAVCLIWSILLILGVARTDLPLWWNWVANSVIIVVILVFVEIIRQNYFI